MDEQDNTVTSRVSRTSEPAGASTATPDLTVYLHFDGYARGPSWPVADYDEQGVFTEQQVAEIVARFGLSPERVSKLSLYVGNTLDSDSLMNLTAVSREKAVKAAQTDLKRAIRHARKDPRRQNRLAELLLACSAQFAETRADAERLHRAQTVARNPETRLADLLDAAEAVLACPGAAARLEPADRRKVFDGRREHIVRSCCYVWMDAGHAITYTTRSGGKADEQRGGPLFDLIHAVMDMVLPDGSRPSDETIRKDIDRFRNLIKRRPELLDGR